MRRQEWLGGFDGEYGTGRDATGQPERQPRLYPFEPPQETAVTDVAQPSQLPTRDADHGWDAQRAAKKSRDETGLAGPECVQHVERATAVLGDDCARRSLPQSCTPTASGFSAAQCGDLRAEDFVRSPASRVPQSENMNVGGTSEADHQVPQGRDAPVTRIGTEPGDNEADPHAPSCRTANSV
jgi:hypothetical protein